MKKQSRVHRIDVAAWDPARGVIAADIVKRGGRPISGESLAYGFRNADHRDRILHDIRGCFGTDCVSASEGEG